MPNQLVITIDRSAVEPIAWAFCCWLVFDLIVRLAALWMKITAEEPAELDHEMAPGMFGAMANLAPPKPMPPPLRDLKEGHIPKRPAVYVAPRHPKAPQL